MTYIKNKKKSGLSWLWVNEPEKSVLQNFLDNSNRWSYKLSATLALIGGGVLLILVIMTCISIFGRSLASIGLRPIEGDFELIEIGVAFAIFSFLSWAQYKDGHARVDVFKDYFSKSLNLSLNLFSNLMMTVIACIIGWRLSAGMLDKFAYNETTYTLQIPLWISYSVCLIGAYVFIIISILSTLNSLAALMRRSK